MICFINIEISCLLLDQPQKVRLKVWQLEGRLIFDSLFLLIYKVNNSGKSAENRTEKLKVFLVNIGRCICDPTEGRSHRQRRIIKTSHCILADRVLFCCIFYKWKTLLEKLNNYVQVVFDIFYLNKISCPFRTAYF